MDMDMGMDMGMDRVRLQGTCQIHTIDLILSLSIRRNEYDLRKAVLYCDEIVVSDWRQQCRVKYTYDTIRYDTIRCNTIQYDTMRYVSENHENCCYSVN
jgi:hypothetical protein